MAVETHGWQSGRSLLDCHKYMLENQVACDVTFLFPIRRGRTRSISAHSYMLRCRSSVFADMLSGNSQKESDGIVIKDIHASFFMDVLRYMYYDEPDLSCHNVLHVLFAAKKYLLGGLVTRCQNFLKNEMSADNVCTILGDCVHYDEKELVADCVDFATSHADSVIDSEDFLEVSHDTLLMLLSNDEFCPTNEMDLLKACMKWATIRDDEADERSTLGEAFYQIRFLMLRPADILNVKAETSNIISDKETLWFLHRIINENSSSELKCDMSLFNCNKRRLQDRIRLKNRFKCTGTKNNSSWRCHGDGPDRISFKCSKDLWFRGITLYGGHKNKDKHLVTMNLLIGHTLSSTTVDIVSDGTDTPIEVLVCEPVRLDAGKLYTVQAKTSGPCTFYGENGEMSITYNNITVTYSTYNGKSNGTGVDRGQIPQILTSRR